MPPTLLLRAEQQARIAQLQCQQPWLFSEEIERIASFAKQLT